MLSRTSEYALRAMIFLAQHEEEAPVPRDWIAQHVGVPSKYLAKILGDLVRVGILTSLRGKGGGFRMARSPRKVSLADVLAPFDPPPSVQSRCPFGNSVCGDDDPCLGHDGWKRVKQVYESFLNRTSVYDVAIKKKTRSSRTAKTSRRKR